MRFVYKNVEGMLRGMARAMCRGIAYPIIDLQMFYKEHSSNGCQTVDARLSVGWLSETCKQFILQVKA